MSSLQLGLGLRGHSASRRHVLRRRARIALQSLVKWNASVWLWVDSLLFHVEYIDVPSLDGMRWCDEVERKIGQSALGERNYLDTCRHGSNRPMGR
jgi:hypothetical protein